MQMDYLQRMGSIVRGGTLGYQDDLTDILSSSYRVHIMHYVLCLISYVLYGGKGSNVHFLN